MVCAYSGLGFPTLLENGVFGGVFEGYFFRKRPNRAPPEIVEVFGRPALCYAYNWLSVRWSKEIHDYPRTMQGRDLRRLRTFLLRIP